MTNKIFFFRYFRKVKLTMKIKYNISLKPYNTFGIDVKANKFIEINSIEELISVTKNKKDFFLLGGGSNILLTQDIENTVLYINIKGIKIIKENKYSVYVEVNAGENWHEFVLWNLKKKLAELKIYL